MSCPAVPRFAREHVRRVPFSGGAVGIRLSAVSRVRLGALGEHRPVFDDFTTVVDGDIPEL